MSFIGGYDLGEQEVCNPIISHYKSDVKVSIAAADKLCYMNVYFLRSFLSSSVLQLFNKTNSSQNKDAYLHFNYA